MSNEILFYKEVKRLFYGFNENYKQRLVYNLLNCLNNKDKEKFLWVFLRTINNVDGKKYFLDKIVEKLDKDFEKIGYIIVMAIISSNKKGGEQNE